jgi:hypothetical protein
MHLTPTLAHGQAILNMFYLVGVLLNLPSIASIFIGLLRDRGKESSIGMIFALIGIAVGVLLYL